MFIYDVDMQGGFVWLRFRIARSSEIMTLKLTPEQASELSASLGTAAQEADEENQ